jgi:sterol 24-C-methyltransferase
MKPTLQQAVQDYSALHQVTQEERSSKYATLAKQFYDLATDFYEFGWGESFHFAPRLKKQSFRDSILTYERRVGRALMCRPGMHLLDLGCGVGGPMRTMAREFDVFVTGININDYQISRGRQHNRTQGLDGSCRLVRADFAHLPLQKNSYDGAYEFQATCHAPDRHKVYAEVFRVLKPGALFVGDEWCLTPRYDDSNPEHRRIKKGIEIGNGLPDVETISGVLNALTTVGFELVEHADLAPTGSPESPWHLPLSETWSAAGLQRTRLGRQITRQSLRMLEHARLVPAGSAAVSDILNTAADSLVQGGLTGIFTPLYFFQARKPA